MTYKQLNLNESCKEMFTWLTHKQAVAVGLFEHPGDAGDVLNGEAEHDQVHGRFAHHVVLFKVLFNFLK